MKAFIELTAIVLRPKVPTFKLHVISTCLFTILAILTPLNESSSYTNAGYTLAVCQASPLLEIGLRNDLTNLIVGHFRTYVCDRLRVVFANLQAQIH